MRSGVRGRDREAAPPPGLKKFRASYVFRASTSCSEIQKDKKYFNAVKSFKANSVFMQEQVA